MTTGYDLDHVALAAADTSDALRFLTGRLGGTVIFGGQSIGFRPMQVWVGTPDGDGMPVELLEPWAVEQNDFLARFVARHGAGPHHLTFKVTDLAGALERVRGAGFHPVNIDVSDPQWKEAFLMPSEAHGTVVQLAESHGASRDPRASCSSTSPRTDPTCIRVGGPTRRRPTVRPRASAARRAAHADARDRGRVLRRASSRVRSNASRRTESISCGRAARGSVSSTGPMHRRASTGSRSTVSPRSTL